MGTRLRAKPMQPIDFVTHSRAGSSVSLINFRQAAAGKNEHGQDGSPSASFANGSFSRSKYSISRCIFMQQLMVKKHTVIILIQQLLVKNIILVFSFILKKIK